jgi:hypothetical protein
MNIRALFIGRLADEYIGPHVRGGGGPGALDIRRLRAHRQTRGHGPLPRLIYSYVTPTNVAPYIHRCHVTDEYLGLRLSKTFVSVVGD